MQITPFSILSAAGLFILGVAVGGFAFPSPDSNEQPPLAEVTTEAVAPAAQPQRQLTDRSPAAAAAQDYAALINALRAEIEAGAAQRRRLEIQIAGITERLDAIDGVNAMNESFIDEPSDPQGQSQVPSPGQQSDRSDAAFAGVSVDALQAVGLSADVADDIIRRYHRDQLDRLELRDRAAREGWLDSDEFDEAMLQLQAQQTDLQAELGDERYDRYLFESGRNNRVRVDFVIPGSQAEQVGLAAGDIIMAYDAERLFNTRSLQTATRAGQRGETVSVQVQRGEELINMAVARGPLGITLNGTQASPGTN